MGHIDSITEFKIMTIDDLNDFLIKHSGTTSQAIVKLISDKPEDQGPVFFKPYTSAGNFFTRTAYVATAPIFLSLLALEISAFTLFTGLKAVYHLATLDTTEAKESAKDLLGLVLITVGTMITALASPFINLVDLVGSIFAKSTENNATTNDEPANDEPAFQP